MTTDPWAAPNPADFDPRMTLERCNYCQASVLRGDGDEKKPLPHKPACPVGQRDELRAALAGLVGCIDESAADRGPEITRGSMMAQVCKVIQTTAQYGRAKAVLDES